MLISGKKNFFPECSFYPPMIGNCNSRLVDFEWSSLCGDKLTASTCFEGSDLFWGVVGFSRTTSVVWELFFWVSGVGFGSRSAPLSCGVSKAAASFCSSFPLIGRSSFALWHGSALGTPLSFPSCFWFGFAFLIKGSVDGRMAAAGASVCSRALCFSGVLLEIHNPNNKLNNI